MTKKICPLCHQPLPDKKQKNQAQKTYYQKNKEKIKDKNAKKLKDPEYRKKHNEAAKKSYHKRKEQKNATAKN